MNIAIDIRCLMEKNLTGVGEYTLNLLTHLFQQDNTNQYYLFYNSRKNVSEILPKFDFPNVMYCGLRWPNKLLNLFLILFKWPKLDILIEHKFKTPAIDLFLFPNISFFHAKCPYIITAHDLSFEFFPEFLSFKRKLWHKIINPRRQFANATKVIAVSENTRTDLSARYGLQREKVITIHSGITENFRKLNPDHPQFAKIKEKYGLPEKFFLFLGTIEPRKNLEALVEAFQRFHEINDEYSLVIVGGAGWKCEKLKRQIDAFNLEHKNKIIMTGFVPDREKIFFYNLASLFVYPSFYEGFGFPPLEAMASGCPVLTSQNSALSEVCGDAALLIDPNDIASICNGLNELLQNRDFYIQKGLINAQKFRWQTAAQCFLIETK